MGSLVLHLHRKSHKMKIIFVRHAEATGQEPEAQLTSNGLEQAKELARFIQKFFKISKITSSPYLRAIQTIEQLSKTSGVPVDTDDKLVECYYAEDWCDETAEEGLTRGLEVIKNMQETECEGVTIVVSHGDLIGLLLKHFGYDTCSLSRPDIYLLDNGSISRLWSDTGALVASPRESARAILFSHDRTRIFLFELSQPAISSNKKPTIWITPGGGVEEGEDLVVCLHRELDEELGLSTSDCKVLGRLWNSQTPMIINGVPKLFIEYIFAVQLNPPTSEDFNLNGQSEEERRVLKSCKWWTAEQIETTDERIVPGLIHKIREVDLDKLSMTEPLANIYEPI